MKHKDAPIDLVDFMLNTITLSRVRGDINSMLNSNEPYRAIFKEKIAFPDNGAIDIVVKQLNVWNYDVCSSGSIYVSIIAALGGVDEIKDVLGEVEASYGFVTLHYNTDAEIVFYYWHRQMWINEIAEEEHEQHKE